MLAIRWNEGEAEGTTDLLPYRWFSRVGEVGFRQHVVLDVEGRTDNPRCSVSVGEITVDLDYSQEHKPHNIEHGYEPGIMRLLFRDGTRSGKPKVVWKDEGEVHFVACNVTVTQRKLRGNNASSFDPKDRQDGRDV